MPSQPLRRPVPWTCPRASSGTYDDRRETNAALFLVIILFDKQELAIEIRHIDGVQVNLQLQVE